MTTPSESCCAREYDEIKSSLLSWKCHDFNDMKPVVDFDLHLRAAGSVATGRVNELSGWVESETLFNSKCSVRQVQSRRFKSAPKTLHRDSLTLQREKSYEFKHFDEIDKYMEQYRKESGVITRSGSPPICADGHAMRQATGSPSRLQLQLWRCEHCQRDVLKNEKNHACRVASTQQTSYTPTQPFDGGLASASASSTSKFTPHIHAKTESPNRAVVRPTAGAQMVREALMARQSSLYLRQLTSNSVIRITGMQDGGRKESRKSSRRGANHYMKRVARSRALRYQDDIVEDMSESGIDEALNGKSNKLSAQSALASSHSSGSLESTSSHQLTYVSVCGSQQLSLKPSTQVCQQPSSESLNPLYKLARPKIATHQTYRLGKQDKDAKSRDMALVTPLLSHRISQESGLPQSKIETTNSIKKVDADICNVSKAVNCKSIPNPVQGLSKQLITPKRSSVLTSRGGGWKSFKDRSWSCGKPFESRLLARKQNSSPSLSQKVSGNLGSLLNVKGRKSEGNIAVHDNASVMNVKNKDES